MERSTSSGSSFVECAEVGSVGAGASVTVSDSFSTTIFDQGMGKRVVKRTR